MGSIQVTGNRRCGKEERGGRKKRKKEGNDGRKEEEDCERVKKPEARFDLEKTLRSFFLVQLSNHSFS